MNAVFEGPIVNQMPTFRHYLLFIPSKPGKFFSTLGHPNTISRTVQTYQARFYEAGTWETDRQVPEMTLPEPKPEILADLDR